MESGAMTPWLGANFWSRTGGPRMGLRYSAAVVREELQVLAAHGCNVTRSFCFWPDFVPAPEQLDEEVLNRFTDSSTRTRNSPWGRSRRSSSGTCRGRT